MMLPTTETLQLSQLPQPHVLVAPASTIKTKDELLLETAQKLGIPTEGKTREQLSEEISVKAKILGAE